MKGRGSTFLSAENAFAGTIAIIAFVGYLTTMCRTVSFIDSGELATVATVLGIAHPTGYPLFTLIGRIAVIVPIALEQVLQLNVFAAVITAVSVGLFFKVVRLMEDLVEEQSGQRRTKGREKITSFICTGVGSLVFAFSGSVWAQSVTIEVYGLHLVLLLLTIITFLKGIQEGTRNGETISPYLLLSSYMLGLSFSNHLTTILIVPALGYLYFQTFGGHRSSVLLLLWLLPSFLFGISTYLYLPIRSQVQPPADWGHPADLQRLLWHVSGKQYRSWIFSGFESARRQLNYFIESFPSQFHWIAIGFILPGIWNVWRLGRRLFWFLLIAFLTCLLYSINYDIYDIDSYFLLCYLVVSLFIAFGIRQVYGLLRGEDRGARSWTVLALLIILPVAQVVSNRKSVDESDNYLVEDYTQSIFQNLEPHAFVLSYQWDYFVAPSLYYQTVRAQRPDVTIIDKELLRRSWYFIHLERASPWLIEGCRSAVQRFLVELHKFEHNLPYSAQVIEARYVEMINDFIEKARERGPVYVGPEIEPEFGGRYRRIPAGALFRLQGPAETIQSVLPKIHYRPTSYEGRLTRALRSLYARMLAQTALQLQNDGKEREARSTVELALQIDPTNLLVRDAMSRISESPKVPPRGAPDVPVK